MIAETAALRAKRSVDSLRFELIVRAAAIPNALPRLVDIDFGQMRELVPWIAIIDPNNESYSLKFVRAGAGISQFLGRDAVGFDYLDIVDPAIKGDAFDSAFLMLTRPCGLWQLTPGVTSDGREITLEYTGFPVFDDAKMRGQLMIFIKHGLPAATPTPRAEQVRHSTVWCWLEMKGELPPG